MTNSNERWALILGASSGFGGATAIELARSGFDIFGLHLDRSVTLPNAERVQEEVRALGRQAVFFNMNASDPDKMAAALDGMQEHLSNDASVGMLLHSLAFGTLRPFVAESPGDVITPKQMDMTLEVMAHSLVYWTQAMVARNMLRAGSKVFAMTSAGATRVWPTYGAVSAAKAALESHVRQLAYELAPRRVAVNAIRAGVTDTAALRKIPGHEDLLAGAGAHNPSGRTTTPEDVAKAIAAFSDERTAWMTGNVIGIDGGEDVVA
jgi:NAD(P)-dependent dehydrogenase (short-subunit alcohol dehydrogenase family)